MPTGKLKWYNSDLSYGFIVPDDGSPDVYANAVGFKKAGIERGRRGPLGPASVALSFGGRVIRRRGRA